jgi:tetratricopeptide (TPR) repeat protein
MNCYRIVVLTALTALIAGCASSRPPAPVEELGIPTEVQTRIPGEITPSPMEAPSGEEAVTIPLGYSGPSTGSEGVTPPAPDASGAPANPAVVALLNDANLAMQNGRDDRAAASLERALSIEPRNAWLWHRLAGTRLKQGDLDQAAALAAKSNTFASSDRKLQAANWRIIADVHRRQGEFDAAQSAEQRATRLESP